MQKCQALLSKQVLYNGPDHIYNCMYHTVLVTVFVTTAIFDGMNNILLEDLKQYTRNIFTIEIQNLIIKSGATFLCKNLCSLSGIGSYIFPPEKA